MIFNFITIKQLKFQRKVASEKGSETDNNVETKGSMKNVLNCLMKLNLKYKKYCSPI